MEHLRRRLQDGKRLARRRSPPISARRTWQGGVWCFAGQNEDSMLGRAHGPRNHPGRIRHDPIPEAAPMGVGSQPTKSIVGASNTTRARGGSPAHFTDQPALPCGWSACRPWVLPLRGLFLLDAVGASGTRSRRCCLVPSQAVLIQAGAGPRQTFLRWVSPAAEATSARRTGAPIIGPIDARLLRRRCGTPRQVTD